MKYAWLYSVTRKIIHTKSKLEKLSVRSSGDTMGWVTFSNSLSRTRLPKFTDIRLDGVACFCTIGGVVCCCSCRADTIDSTCLVGGCVDGDCFSNWMSHVSLAAGAFIWTTLHYFWYARKDCLRQKSGANYLRLLGFLKQPLLGNISLSHSILRQFSIITVVQQIGQFQQIRVLIGWPDAFAKV